MTKEHKDFKLLCLVLSRMTFLSTGEKLILLKKLDSLHNLIVLYIEDISTIIGRTSKAFWDGELFLRQARQDLCIIEKLGISTVIFDDIEYPAMLKEISDPPFLLYYRGNLQILRNPCVSVVGTRRMTAECAAECMDFSKTACLNGTNVVSGLAFGVDRKAHEGALQAKNFLNNSSERNMVGKTVAVLPGAIDNIVPGGNKKLAAKILESGGLILSEYPPGEGAKPYRFIQRNRIIAGLSCATVVMQAPPGSGAMHTVAFALDYNREVMFHKAAFCESSQRISSIVKRQLEKTGNETKLQMDPELYVQEGAPVINDYADFCRCMIEAPEKRNCRKMKETQPTLFD